MKASRPSFVWKSAFATFTNAVNSIGATNHVRPHNQDRSPVRRKTNNSAAASGTSRQTFYNETVADAAAGLGGSGGGGGGRASLFSSPAHGGGGSTTTEHNFNDNGGRGVRGRQPTFQPGGGTTPGSAVVIQPGVDDIFIDRPDALTGARRRPVSYELEVRRRAHEEQQRQEEVTRQFNEHFDEAQMPRRPDDPHRPRAAWEFTPDEDHRALVLLLYRQTLKGLVHFKSVRRRSLIAYARFAFRRRAAATEKLLVDECVEECRRAIYVLQKHHNFTDSKNYEYDIMTMPKDTGQDVKTYMEEVYDPEISRMQFQQFTDVQPGREAEHRQGLSPTSGSHHWRDQKDAKGFKVELREEDMVRRPPPPPDMA